MDHDNMGLPDSPSTGNTNPVWDKNPKWKFWEIAVVVIIALAIALTLGVTFFG